MLLPRRCLLVHLLVLQRPPPLPPLLLPLLLLLGSGLPVSSPLQGSAPCHAGPLHGQEDRQQQTRGRQAGRQVGGQVLWHQPLGASRESGIHGAGVPKKKRQLVLACRPGMPHQHVTWHVVPTPTCCILLPILDAVDQRLRVLYPARQGRDNAASILAIIDPGFSHLPSLAVVHTLFGAPPRLSAPHLKPMANGLGSRATSAAASWA